jgi:hypothetical protein
MICPSWASSGTVFAWISSIKNVKLAGWIMNKEKSELTPSQDFIFIGIRFCTRVELMFPPPDRIIKIMSRVGQFPHGRLYIRPLLLLLLSRWGPHQDPWIGKFQNPYYEKFGNFGTQRLISIRECCNNPPPPKLSMFTDASNFGWGAHVNEVDLTTKGTWSQEESKISINILELKAILLCVKDFRNHLKNQSVSLFSDISTVVASIRKQGGTHSPVLCRMTWELLQFCRRENIVLVSRHIPGKHNILADTLSRSSKLVSTEWTIHMDVVQVVRGLWGSPTIDLFATKMNNRLPRYMSPLPDPKALAVNALAISWDGMNAYAFPLTALIQAVLNKVMTDKVRLCLIAPCWPSQAWFPTLLELLTDHPRRLPEWDHLLWHPIGRI